MKGGDHIGGGGEDEEGHDATVPGRAAPSGGPLCLQSHTLTSSARKRLDW